MNAKARRGVRNVLMDMIGSPFFEYLILGPVYINLP